MKGPISFMRRNGSGEPASVWDSDMTSNTLRQHDARHFSALADVSGEVVSKGGQTTLRVGQGSSPYGTQFLKQNQSVGHLAGTVEACAAPKGPARARPSFQYFFCRCGRRRGVGAAEP